MTEATQQQKAYDQGVKEGALGMHVPELTGLWVQESRGYDDESLVCYLNGVGDGLAGTSARGDLLMLPRAA